MCQNSVLFKFSGIYPANINIVVFFFTHLFINFVCAAGIFCSDVDQNRYVLPEIQERLAESLRLPQSPVVHEQIFLFFRVLTLRMSARHLTPLWPTIVSEVVHVLLQMESDLGSDGKSHKQRMVISELLLGSNGYVNYSQEKWLGLYLAVCKLLDLSQALPSDYS